MSELIIICPNCGEPYYFYAYTVADQSRCPACISKLKARIEKNRQRRGTENRDHVREKG